MTRFRRLSFEELNELEKEFVEFLILNGVDADTWVSIKSNDPGNADKIIDQFSDVVFASIFRKAEFVDVVTATKIKCFHFQKDQVVLVGIDSVDYKTNFMEAGLDELKDQEYDVYTTQKSYSKSREEEMFKMISNGGELSDGKLFKKICLAL